MEAVGVALGVASLGIETCKILLKFYGDFQSQNDDIREIYGSVSRLSNLLQQCYSVLNKITASDDARNCVARSVIACEEAVKNLNEKAKKCRGVPNPRNLLEKLRHGEYRLKYPFRRATLLELKGIVEGTLEDLGVAIDLLQLQVSIEGFAALKAEASRLSQQATAAASTMARIEKITQSTATDVKTLLSDNERYKLQSALDWLDAPDPSSNHHNARDQHEPETGNWFLRSSEYKRWLDGGTGPLWLYGKAGCCKTVLCSTIIEDLRAQLARGLDGQMAYFYFTFRDELKQSYDQLLLSLIEQLSQDRPLIPALESAHTSGKKDWSKLETIFETLLGRSSTTYIVLDALDECPELHDRRANLLGRLTSLARRQGVRIFVTSRDLNDIRAAMVTMHGLCVKVDDSCVNEDIMIYVTQHLDIVDVRTGGQKFTSRQKQLIQTTFEEKSNGMFQWAHCQMEELKRRKFLRQEDLAKCLNELPMSLDETYERVLLHIERVYQCGEGAKIALQWLAFCLSPMTVEELVEACITDWLPEPRVKHGDRSSMLNIIETLGPLIEIKSQAHADSAVERMLGSCVHLAHFSVREYLLAMRIKDGSAGRFFLEEKLCLANLAQGCAAYILYCLDQRYDDNMEEEYLNFAPATRFLEHAAMWWYRYQSKIESAKSSNQECALSVRLLDTQLLRGDWRDLDSSRRYLDTEPPLVAAASFNLPRTCIALLDAGHSPNVFSDGPIARTTPLDMAALLGNIEIAQILLERDADPNFTDGTTPLCLAVSHGHLDMVRLLLEHHANPNLTNDKRTPLLAAVQNSWHDHQVSIVELLLENGAHITWHIVATACHCGRLEAVKLFLGKRIDVGERGEGGQTLLHATAKHDYWVPKDNCKDIAQALIEHGAEVDAADDLGITPLWYACRAQRHDASFGVVETLIRHRASAKALGPQNESALQWAIRIQSLRVAEMLIANGADVDHEDDNGVMPLGWVGGTIDAASLLLHHGANVDLGIERPGSNTPLKVACAWATGPTLELVQFLVDRGATIVKHIVVHGIGRDWTPNRVGSGTSESGQAAQYLIDRGAQDLWFELWEDFDGKLLRRIQLTDDDGDVIEYEGGWQAYMVSDLVLRTPTSELSETSSRSSDDMDDVQWSEDR